VVTAAFLAAVPSPVQVARVRSVPEVAAAVRQRVEAAL
jgi:hypothetical protein